MKNKVFCIGFHKTGTTSLSHALHHLGYSVTGPNGVNDINIDKNVFTMAYDLVEKYDAFQDNPWPIIYKELDLKFPNSKFILTLRDSKSWLNSQIKHFGKEETPMRKWIYGAGCPEGNEDLYIKRFEEHNNQVMNYFSKRTGDLLIMSLFKNDGWEKLCPFLGAEIPNITFPHANKARDRENNEHQLKKLIMSLLRKIS